MQAIAPRSWLMRIMVQMSLPAEEEQNEGIKGVRSNRGS